MSSSAHRLVVWIRLLLACFALAGAAPAIASPVVDAVELRAEAAKPRRGERDAQRAVGRFEQVDLHADPVGCVAAHLGTRPRVAPWPPWNSRRLFIVQRALLV